MLNNVMVVGGSGFIGSHLVEKLCHKGYNTVVLVRRNSKTKFLNSLGVELRFGDLLVSNSLKEALKGVETVFCVTNVKHFDKSPKKYEEELYRLHMDGTRNLIEACLANNVRRLVYFSSVAAMGYQKGVNIYDESSGNNPFDAYGRAKLEAEEILHGISKKGKLAITILRPPGVFGERGVGVLKKVIFFAGKRVIPVLGSGENRQSFAYVGNVVNQAIFLAENSGSVGKTYIISDERPYSVNELIDTVFKVMNVRSLKIHIPVWFVMFCVLCINFFGIVFLKRKVINKENIVAIAGERIFDGSRIFRKFDYKQEYDLAQGITRTIQWYKKENV